VAFSKPFSANSQPGDKAPVTHTPEWSNWTARQSR
jgi:hypothetical protein